MRPGAVSAEAVRSADGVRLRAHVGRGAGPDVGRGRPGLLPAGDAQPEGHPLARDHLPEHLRLVSGLVVCTGRVRYLFPAAYKGGRPDREVWFLCVWWARASCPVDQELAGW